MPPLRLYLASASPRRLALLRQVGLEPAVARQDVDESRLPGETARDLVMRLAELKGRSAATALGDSRALVVAADTEVVLGDEVLGKPKDADHAAAMLRRLRGRDHHVLTGVFVGRTDTGTDLVAVESTRVRFRDFDEATLAAYVAGGEPMDKAGAYGIQGGGALLAAGIEGSWSNVVGFPLERLSDWLTELGVDLVDLIRDGQEPVDSS